MKIFNAEFAVHAEDTMGAHFKLPLALTRGQRSQISGFSRMIGLKPGAQRSLTAQRKLGAI